MQTWLNYLRECVFCIPSFRHDGTFTERDTDAHEICGTCWAISKGGRLMMILKTYFAVDTFAFSSQQISSFNVIREGFSNIVSFSVSSFIKPILCIWWLRFTVILEGKTRRAFLSLYVIHHAVAAFMLIGQHSLQTSGCDMKMLTAPSL